MSFMPITNRAGILAGIYLVNAIVAPMPVYFGVSLQLASKRHWTCLTPSSGQLLT